MRRYSSQIGLFLFIGVLLYLLYVGHRSEVAEQAGVGAAAAPFSIHVLGSRRMTGPQDHLGKVVLIDFWATYCRPCRDTLPIMQTIYDSYDEDEFSLLSVNVDPDHTDISRYALVRTFVRSLHLDFPVLMDHGPASNAYYVNQIPYLVLIDKRGMVRYVYDVPVSEDTLRRHIDELLAEP